MLVNRIANADGAYRTEGGEVDGVRLAYNRGGPRPIDSIATPAERRSALARFAATGELTLGELDLFWDRTTKVYWQYMRPAGRASFTFGLLADLREALYFLTDMYAEATPADPQPVRYAVLASRIPGIFNLGGDLPHFAELIRSHDRSVLRRYAHACIEVQYPRATNVGLPIVGIALVQGDALGGGFEAALACNVIVAEKRAKFGLPEVLFNLFPGMGALSFLTRRVGMVEAERMVFSGRIYTAEDLHAMGVVDVLAEDGQGEQAVQNFISRIDRSFASRLAVYGSRQTIQPVSREELMQITERWVDAALALGAADIRKMERLAAAQDRRWATIAQQQRPSTVPGVEPVQAATA
jgi:DSF synthase